jgi:hypothetical protein
VSPLIPAEREGFEPSGPVSQANSLAVSPIRPLSHLSLPTIIGDRGTSRNRPALAKNPLGQGESPPGAYAPCRPIDPSQPGPAGTRHPPPSPKIHRQSAGIPLRCRPELPTLPGVHEYLARHVLPPKPPDMPIPYEHTKVAAWLGTAFPAREGCRRRGVAGLRRPLADQHPDRSTACPMHLQPTPGRHSALGLDLRRPPTPQSLANSQVRRQVLGGRPADASVFAHGVDPGSACGAERDSCVVAAIFRFLYLDHCRFVWVLRPRNPAFRPGFGDRRRRTRRRIQTTSLAAPYRPRRPSSRTSGVPTTTIPTRR